MPTSLLPIRSLTGKLRPALIVRPSAGRSALVHAAAICVVALLLAPPMIPVAAEPVALPQAAGSGDHRSGGAVEAAFPAPGFQSRDLPAGYWKDVDGNPLPFQSDAEIIEFMQTATVESTESIPVGITRPRRVVLARDGVRMRAVLRDFDQIFEDTRISGRFYWRIRDSYLFDIAAYELARMLELDWVPPVTLRRVGGVNASLQAWVEDALVESDRQAEGIEPPDEVADRFRRHYQLVLIFDTLIGNVDRNAGNVLYDRHWNFWLIDHSRSFLPSDTVLPYLESIVACDRGLYERLRNLERQELVDRLTPPLEGSDIDWMLARRDVIVARLQTLIAEHGADRVLFDQGRGPSTPSSDRRR